jgi:adenylate kinase
MLVILMGPPGAGKGTQAERVTKEFDLLHISTGDILRGAVKEETPLGKEAQEYMERGALVPDEVIINIMKDRLGKPDCAGGVLLDGFPRTVEQGEALDHVLNDLNLNIDAVINVDVSPDELLERLTGRRVCRSCGSTYHMKFNPPRVRNICDHCSGELYQRSDDAVDTVKERLEVYSKQTIPLIQYYQRKNLYHAVDGARPIDEVFEGIATYLREGKANN